MMAFSSCLDEIIDSILEQYAKIGPENTPQSVRAVIQAPMMQQLLPSIIIDVGIINFQKQTYALIGGWSVCNPNLADARTITANLISLEELLDEYLNDEESEEDEDE